jgi:hypothetical protein
MNKQYRRNNGKIERVIPERVQAVSLEDVKYEIEMLTDEREMLLGQIEKIDVEIKELKKVVR